MNHLVVGLGEVGKAILALLKEKFEARGIDTEQINGQFDVLHICFPYSKNFVKSVKENIKRYSPGLVIIHSTVKVGTTEKIGNIAVHSPVMGVHPNLLEGIKTFSKFFGGARALEAADIFNTLGVESIITRKSKETELAKLLDTTYYGWNIIFNKEAKKICDKYGADFEGVYTRWNIAYNIGYSRLGRPEVIRPVLKYMPGKIGGHCVRENAKLLNEKLFKIIYE